MQQVDYKSFIDFDKNNQSFYHNLYFETYNLVLKIRLLQVIRFESLNIKEKTAKIIEEKLMDLRLESFDLTNSVYLLSY